MRSTVLLALARGFDRLAEALLDRADVDVVGVAERSVNAARDAGIPCRLLESYLPQEVRPAIEQEAIRRTTAIAKALHSSDVRGAWGNDTDARWQAVREQVEQVLRRDFYFAMVFTEAMHRLMDAADLRLVVVHEDISLISKVLLHTAKRLNVPSLHSLHGVPSGARFAIDLHQPPLADVIAVPSAYSREIYEGLGVPAERIAVTGNFEWDVYARPPAAGFRERVCAELGLDPARPVVVYAQTYTHAYSRISAERPDYTRKITGAVVAAFGELNTRHPDWQFVYRPHPNDLFAEKDLTAAARAAGLKRIVTDNHTAPVACVAMADVLLCTHSNLALEAVMYGKPVVNVALDAYGKAVFEEGIGPFYREDDALLLARCVEDIAPAVEAAMTDPATRARLLERRPATVARLAGEFDGRATERLAALLCDMIRTGKPFYPLPPRFPELEHALAEQVPQAARRVAVLGDAARFVADGVRWMRADAEAAIAANAQEARDADVVVLADPLPVGPEAEMLLASVAKHINPEKVVVFAALKDGSQRCLRGVEIVLSRCGLDTVSTAPLSGQSAGWVVVARSRGEGSGDVGRKQARQRKVAQAANAEGEAAFHAGDLYAAKDAFSYAIAANPRYAAAHSNLGAVLHALGEPHSAWDAVVTALHYDASLESARDNLRALGQVLGRENEAEEILSLWGEEE